MLRAMFLPLLLLCFSAFRQTAVSAISMGCSSQDYLEGNSYSFDCFLGRSSSTGSWSLISPTGQVTDIGSCTSDGNCTHPVFSNFLLNRYGKTQNRLNIQSVRKTSTGTLVCSEHHSDGSVERVNCTLNVLSVLMSGCGSRGYERAENSDTSVTCYTSDSTRPMTWSLGTPAGETKILGSCTGVNICSSPHSPYISVTRPSTRYSALSIDNIKRETAGTLTCSDGTDTHNCTLDVYNRAVVENCTTLQIHRTNWTVVTTCDVTMAYSALGKFEYRVLQYWLDSQYGISRNDYSDYQPYTPSPYISASTGKGFYRGTYTASWPLPMLYVADGTYSYRTNTNPGNVYNSIEGSFIVERPPPPSVQCEGALRDAGRVPCVCSTSSLGSPAGRLIWLSGDTVFAAGQYGVTSLQFPTNVTVDGCDVMQITCQLDWVLKQNFSFPLACADTHITDNIWGITVSVLLGVVVVAIVILVIVLLRRGVCSRKLMIIKTTHDDVGHGYLPNGGGGDPDAGTVHFSQHQPQAEDPVHTYSGLNIQHAAGRRENTGSAHTRTTSLADSDPEEVYENTDVSDKM